MHLSEMLIFPRKYQHSGPLSRPGTDFSLFPGKLSTNWKSAEFCEKVRFSAKINFFGVRNAISGPIAQNLFKPMLFRCFGHHFWSFGTFSLNFSFFAHNPTFPQRQFSRKVIFLRLGVHFRVILAPSRQPL